MRGGGARGVRALLAAALLLQITPATAEAPRAALISAAPLQPSPAALSVTRRRLGAGYLLLEGPLVKELETLDREPTAERLVQDLLRDAVQKMRRLALPEVQRVLNEAEPYVQQLPPTASGRALLCAVAVRKAHVALLQNEGATAAAELSRTLSADPDFTLDQAQEPPPLLALFEQVRAVRAKAPTVGLRIETVPAGAQVVLSAAPRGAAPLEVAERAGRAVVFAVMPGYLPRNVSVTLEPQPPGAAPLSVQIQLERAPRTQALRPLLDALREAPAVPARAAVAQALVGELGVETVILAQAGAGGRLSLWAYGAGPAPALGSTGLPFDLVVYPAPLVRRGPRPWVTGLLGAAAGLLVGGIVAGVTVYALK